jgi:hypothetical protein
MASHAFISLKKRIDHCCVFFSRLVRLLTCGVVWFGMLYIEIIGYI